MFSRISGVLSLSYIFTFIGGLGYLLTDAPSVGADGEYQLNVALWGWFYLIGGLIAALSTIVRPFLLRKITSFWYFEISGICLIVSANFVHAYSLYIASLELDQYNLLSLMTIIIAFSGVLVSRVVEVFGLIRYLKQYSVFGGDINE